MKRTLIISALLLLLGAVGLACVAKSRMNYSDDQLANLTETEELMRVLYNGLSPVWDVVKKPTLSPADLKLMVDVAPRVDAVATALASKGVASKYKEGFAARAGDLGKHARDMAQAAGANAEPAARKALEGINESCGACHGEFK